MRQARGTRLYDPAAGTGVLLGRAADRLAGRGVAVDLFGQEISARACAICQADMLLRGATPRISCSATHWRWTIMPAAALPACWPIPFRGGLARHPAPGPG
ncbi:N-6 DNA methylase [Komagataeibacter rhaeticus]|nr:N-6 DNA methylase [Komagataeibacter rhaeticus]